MIPTASLRLIDDYMLKVSLALVDTQPAERQDILVEVRAHIVERWQQLPDGGEAATLSLLDRVGDPSEIAEAARADGNAPAATVADGVLTPSRTGVPLWRGLGLVILGWVLFGFIFVVLLGPAVIQVSASGSHIWAVALPVLIFLVAPALTLLVVARWRRRAAMKDSPRSQ